MGLFDFTRTIGKKIFGDADDASEKLHTHIAEDNPGIDDLSVTVSDGTVTLKGKAKSATAYQKAILMAGNALGIEKVHADELEAPEPAFDVTYHIVEKGESLWKIAERFYGNGSKYTGIFEENREIIKEPDLIFPGQKIRIPANS